MLTLFSIAGIGLSSRPCTRVTSHLSPRSSARVQNAGVDVLLLGAREHFAEVAGIAVGAEQLHAVVEQLVGYQRMIVD